MAILAFLLGGGFVILSVALLLMLLTTKSREAELRHLLFLIGPEDGPASTPVPQFAVMNFAPAGLVRKFRRAGWEPNGWRLTWIGMAVLAIAAAAFVAGGAAAGFAACLTALLLLWGLLEYRAQARMRTLSDNMLGFLERVRQLLSVGNSLPVALARAAEHSPAMVSRSLASTIRRISNGDGVAESLDRCAEEFNVYEIQLLATAARTNLRFGGSMGVILSNIIENIRKRAAIERELRADTTQIRASAWVLGLLPLAVAGVVMFTNASYSRWFFTTPRGHTMLIYAAGSQLIGAYLMRLITRTRY